MSIDVESGESSLCPVMHDISQERISFIRRVYFILTFQLLLTIAIVSVVVFVPPVANFLNNNIHDGVLEIVTLFAFCSLCCANKKHPICYFFYLIFTVSVALSVGLTCATVGGVFASGKITILEVVTLTIVVVISLSLFTFWATKRGHNFNILGPFLFGVLLIIFFVGLIQILYFPFGKLSAIIYGCLIAVILYGLVVCFTYHLILSYADYISMSASLYLYVISVFLYHLSIFAIAELIKKR
ncbi:hypothetical protein P8452_05927 [Trifolium repens]|nr:hypothetical protein P8452_05927 [Trifolium repens]